MGRALRKRDHVFINLAFDPDYEWLYLALIVGLSSLGFIPRSVLQAPAEGQARLKRIRRVLRECGSSVHDLSCVKLSNKAPRFNMPFELGLAAEMKLADNRYHWFVMEARRYRLQKSLSDLNGHDPLIHEGKPIGVLRALRNAFRTQRTPPRLEELLKIHKEFSKAAKKLKAAEHGASLFDRNMFDELVALAMGVAARALGSRA